MTRNDSQPDRDRQRPGRPGLTLIMALIIFASAAFIYAPGMDDILGFGLSDNNHYLFLAESLAQGGGYRDIFLVSQGPDTRIHMGISKNAVACCLRPSVSSQIFLKHRAGRTLPSDPQDLSAIKV